MREIKSLSYIEKAVRQCEVNGILWPWNGSYLGVCEPMAMMRNGDLWP
jgi:hypothetical protein